jgi:hypothetical protein
MPQPFDQFVKADHDGRILIRLPHPVHDLLIRDIVFRNIQTAEQAASQLRTFLVRQLPGLLRDLFELHG